jgi:hypothetical protein
MSIGFRHAAARKISARLLPDGPRRGWVWIGPERDDQASRRFMGLGGPTENIALPAWRRNPPFGGTRDQSWLHRWLPCTIRTDEGPVRSMTVAANRGATSPPVSAELRPSRLQRRRASLPRRPLSRSVSTSSERGDATVSEMAIGNHVRRLERSNGGNVGPARIIRSVEARLDRSARSRPRDFRRRPGVRESNR